MKSILLLFLALSFGTIASIPFGGTSYDLKYVELVLVLLFLIVIFKLLKRGELLKLTPFYKIFNLLWFLCLIYSMLAYFWSNEPATALSGSLVLIFGMLALVIANYYLNQNPNIFVKANRILNISLFIQLIINMAQAFGSSGLSFYLMKELSNTLIGNSNYISFYFTFGLLYELIAKEKKWIIFTFINLFGVILTISRGAIISITICLFVYFVIVLFNKNKNKIGAFLSLGLLFSGFFIFINYTVPGMELWQGLQYGLQASSVGTRQILWGQALDQIKDNPFGNGIVWGNDPHNIVLKTFRDLGIMFGFVFLFLICYPLFYFLKMNIFKLSSKPIAILIAYLSVFVHSLVEVFYFSSISIIWVIMVLTFLNATIRNEMKQYPQ